MCICIFYRGVIIHLLVDGYKLTFKLHQTHSGTATAVFGSLKLGIDIDAGFDWVGRTFFDDPFWSAMEVNDKTPVYIMI